MSRLAVRRQFERNKKRMSLIGCPGVFVLVLRGRAAR
jgi:hypothetical protein